MKKLLLILALFLSVKIAVAQNTFPYDVQLTPITIANLPGLHSYAFGQHNGKWLIIGGRKDGVHARQPCIGSCTFATATCHESKGLGHSPIVGNVV